MQGFCIYWSMDRRIGLHTICNHQQASRFLSSGNSRSRRMVVLHAWRLFSWKSCIFFININFINLYLITASCWTDWYGQIYRILTLLLSFNQTWRSPTPLMGFSIKVFFILFIYIYFISFIDDSCSSGELGKLWYPNHQESGACSWIALLGRRRAAVWQHDSALEARNPFPYLWIYSMNLHYSF